MKEGPYTKYLESLSQSFQELPPAWLLVGVPGADKSCFAYDLAQKILCTHLSGEQSVLICRQITSGVYPNFFTLKKDNSERSVEDIRGLIHYLQQSAPLPGWRVALIEDVDTLNHYAANALLKTLEDPPPQTLIIATAVTAARVLPTLRSRCMLFVLSGLCSLSDSPLAVLAQGRENGVNDLSAVGGLDFYSRIGNAIKMAIRGDFRSLMPFIEKIAQEELTFTVAIDLIEQFLYRLITYAALQSSQHCVPGEEGIFRELLQGVTIEHWLSAQQALVQFLHEGRSAHLDKKHLLMACFIIIENPEGVNV